MINLKTSALFDEKPLMAIETDSKGRKIVRAIGNSAISTIGQNISVVNPFSHPRSLLADFQVGEKILQHAFSQLLKNFERLPDVIIHPMEKIEGGLTQIEKRALRELLVNSGAYEAFLHIGLPLTTSGREFSELIRNMEKLN